MEHGTLNRSIAAEIRVAMARRNLSQNRLAISLGWSQSQPSRRLGGQIAFNTEDLERIARALEIPVSELTSPRALAS